MLTKTASILSLILSLTLVAAPADAEEKPEIVRAPLTAGAWYEQFDKALFFVVTGAPGKNVWGTDIYPIFSEIAPAAVHAGALKIGETAVLKVTIVKCVDTPATTRNGVTLGLH